MVAAATVDDGNGLEVLGDINSAIDKISTYNFASVATIAELKALPVPSVPAGRTAVVTVAGYNVVSDSGGGEFAWQSTSTTADNGIDVIVPASNPASGRWVRINVDNVNPEKCGAAGDGTTNDYVKVYANINYLGSNDGVIVIRHKHLIGTNLTIPRNVCLRIEHGGGFVALNSSITITINGPFIAPRSQCFFGFGLGKVTFDSGYSNAVPRDVYPEWWGTNNGFDRDDIAWNNAILAGNDVVGRGQYSIGGDILVPYGGYNLGGLKRSISGSGPGMTLVAAANNLKMLHWAACNGYAANITFNANGHTGCSALRVTPEDETQTSTVVNQNHNTFERMFFYGGLADSVVLRTGPNVSGTDSNCYWNTFRDMHFSSVSRGVLFSDSTGGSNPAIGSGSNSNSFYGMKFTGSMNVGIQIDAGGGNQFYSPHFEGITLTTPYQALGIGLIVANTMANTGENPNNIFWYPHWENVTVPHNIQNAKTLLIMGDDDLSACTGLTNLPGRISMNSTDADNAPVSQKTVDATVALAATTSGTITINSSYRTMRFVKKGNKVSFTGYLSVSSVSSPVGQVNITGLPFTAGSGTKNRAVVNVQINSITGTIAGITGKIQEGTNYITLYDTTTGQLGAIASKFQAGTDLTVSGFFFV